MTKKSENIQKIVKLFNKVGSLNRTNKSIILIIFSLIGIIGLTYILMNTNFSEVVEFFQNTTFLLIALFVIVQILLMAVLTMRWAVILESQGHKRINLFRLNKYRVAGQAVSFFTPTAKMGGEGVKTKLMSKRESVPYSQALSSVVIDNAVDLTASGVFFFIGTIIVLLSITAGLATKIFLSGVVLLFLALLAIFNYRLFKGKPIIYGVAKKLGLFRMKIVRKVERDIMKFDKYLHDFYCKDKKHFYYAMTLSFISWILMFLEYYIAGRMLGFNFSLWMIFLIVTLIGIAYLIPVPMALGTLEAGQISAFSILNISASAGIGLSFIVRAKDLLIAFWGVGIISFYGFDPMHSLEKAGFGDEVELQK
jgi:glycosyltransferase 2 family protein